MTGAEPKVSFSATSVAITVPGELQTKETEDFACLKFR